MENNNCVSEKLEYGTSNININSNKSQSSECPMEKRKYMTKVNENGNYEITRYNETSKFDVTVEFLGTGNETEIADCFIQILKGNFIERNLKKSIDTFNNGEYNPSSKGESEV